MAVAVRVVLGPVPAFGAEGDAAATGRFSDRVEHFGNLLFRIPSGVQKKNAGFGWLALVAHFAPKDILWLTAPKRSKFKELKGRALIASGISGLRQHPEPGFRYVRITARRFGTIKAEAVQWATPDGACQYDFLALLDGHPLHFIMKTQAPLEKGGPGAARLIWIVGTLHYEEGRELSGK
jgi:hypothetical protein